MWNKVGLVVAMVWSGAVGQPAIANQEDEDPLIQAVLERELEGVKRALAEGADVGSTGWQGYTALHHAVFAGDWGIANFLVWNGAELEVQGPLGRTPLHLAAQRNRVECVEVLLKFGANPIARDELGRTPLHLAAVEGAIDVLWILDRAAGDVILPDARGMSPLHLACAYGKPQAVRALRRADNVSVVTENGRTAWHWAGITGGLQIRYAMAEVYTVSEVTDAFGYDPQGYFAEFGASGVSPREQLVGASMEGAAWDKSRPVISLSITGDSMSLTTSGYVAAFWRDGTVYFARDPEVPGIDMAVGRVPPELVQALAASIEELGPLDLNGEYVGDLHDDTLRLKVNGRVVSVGSEALARRFRERHLSAARSLVQSLKLSRALLLAAIPLKRCALPSKIKFRGLYGDPGGMMSRIPPNPSGAEGPGGMRRR